MADQAEQGVEGMSAPLTCRFSPSLLREITAIQAARLDQPGRSAVVRELVAEAVIARRGKSTSHSAPLVG
jgi:hypothetical protein